MSIKSWRKEFFDGVKKSHIRSQRSAVISSLRKWTGFLVTNRKKHKVDIKVLSVEYCGSLNCPLCQFVKEKYTADVYYSLIRCEKCSLYRCFNKSCLEYGSPFRLFLKKYNAGIMVRALRKTLRMLDTERKNNG